MANTLTKVLIHFIFSTKNREPWIPQEIEPDLFAYIGGTCRAHGCALPAAGAAADHVHLLISFSKTITMADLLLHIKRDSSKWIKARRPGLSHFHWQGGYAGLSVGQSQIPALRSYFAKQRAHHAKVSFKDELLMFLRKYEIEFDERYLWD